MAVTLMRCVVILLDLTHVHVQQDSQEMDSHALVSRLSTILSVYVCFLSEQQGQQYKSLLCSSRLLQLKFWLAGIYINFIIDCI